MNVPNQSVPTVEMLKNAKQREDYTGQFTEDIDNAEEIRAIENDPTQFPNSKSAAARDPCFGHRAL